MQTVTLDQKVKKGIVAFLILLTSGACSLAQSIPPTATLPIPPTIAPPFATETASSTFTATLTETPTTTATATLTPTITETPTITPSPTITETPTVTITPTYDYPDVSVKMQANCRYGPGTAYLYRWGLYPGDQADVRGRNWNGTWYWIHPFNLGERQNCWASEIVFNEKVDISQVPVVTIPLPHTTFAGPPGNIQAVRDGNQVIVTWDPVPLSDDKRRGYLLEAQTCQNGLLFPIIVQTDDTRYVFEDKTSCQGESSGLLYTAEKHGYSDPVKIPWPSK